MKKRTLSLDDAYDFELIGISCHMKDYRLCWALNKSLNMELERARDIEIFSGNDHVKHLFSLYIYEAEEDYLTYNVMANRGAEGLLVPEAREVDFFLQIVGHLPSEAMQSMISDIKNIPNVLTAFRMEADQLKSKSNLLL